MKTLELHYPMIQFLIKDVVYFESKYPLGIERQNKLKEFTILQRKPRSHIDISNVAYLQKVVLTFKG